MRRRAVDADGGRCSAAAARRRHRRAPADSVRARPDRGAGPQVAAIGERVVVLKGGLMALGSSAGIDLVDIDILTEPASASRIAGLLDSRGYLTYGPGSPVHLAQRRQEFAVPIEVHHALTELPASDVRSEERRVG